MILVLLSLKIYGLLKFFFGSTFQCIRWAQGLITSVHMYIVGGQLN